MKSRSTVLNTDTSDWVIGLQGLRLTEAERTWLRRSPPRGVILFSRNTTSAEQTAALIDEVRQITGKPLLAAIDEEGGRIWRMPFPPFNQRLTAAAWLTRYRRDPEATLVALRDEALICGQRLKALGFTHNCAPVLDVLHPVTHAIIGDRSFGETPAEVQALATACMQGYHDAGIAAIGKHFPGHGLARSDSHLSLPVVEEDAIGVMRDAEVFRQAIAAGLRHIMTAHVHYAAVDGQIATFSPYWLQTVLRQQFHFTGDIWSDDLCMQGAGEHLPQAIRQARQAGCNVLLICQPEAVASLYRQ